MKNTRKGFTLVELVIVIAVIAILAGVLIFTFASVTKRASETAKIQEMKSAEIAQKAEDILAKIDNTDWFGWEDFETKIVEKLTKEYQKTTTSKADIESAVAAAIEDYVKNHASESTGLTAEQVEAIVNNALGTLKYEGVTEAQVRAIVNVATNSLSNSLLGSQLSAAQVRSIVNAANSKNLTAEQVSALLASYLDGVVTSSELENRLKTLLENFSSQIETVTNTLLTKEDIENIVAQYQVVSVTIDAQDDISAIDWTQSRYFHLTILTTDDLTVTTDENVVIVVEGDSLGNITFTTPNASVYLKVDVNTATINAVANDSLHVFKKINNLIFKKGRLVLEKTGVIGALDVQPTDTQVVIYTYIGSLINIVNDSSNNVQWLHRGHIDVFNGTVGEVALSASIFKTTSDGTIGYLVNTETDVATAISGVISITKEIKTETLTQNEIAELVTGSNEEESSKVYITPSYMNSVTTYLANTDTIEFDYGLGVTFANEDPTEEGYIEITDLIEESIKGIKSFYKLDVDVDNNNNPICALYFSSSDPIYINIQNSADIFDNSDIFFGYMRQYDYFNVTNLKIDGFTDSFENDYNKVAGGGHWLTCVGASYDDDNSLRKIYNAYVAYDEFEYRILDSNLDESVATLIGQSVKFVYQPYYRDNYCILTLRVDNAYNGVEYKVTGFEIGEEPQSELVVENTYVGGKIFK